MCSEQVGGHHHPYSAADYWQPVTYASTAGGTAVVRAVVAGLGLADVLGHALVVHAADGDVRLGCGVLQPLAHGVGRCARLVIRNLQ